MRAFVAAILAVSIASLVADALVLNWLIASGQKPVRVWGRLGAIVYHAALTAWASALAMVA
jgi:hypothetical protein